MIVIMRTITLFLITMLSTLAHAGTASCSLINDHDARMMCFASSTGNSSYCGFVKDHDLKLRCYAMTGR